MERDEYFREATLIFRWCLAMALTKQSGKGVCRRVATVGACLYKNLGLTSEAIACRPYRD